jgi:hypothetical protein
MTTTEPTQTMITMSAGSVACLLEALDYCDEFLRTTPPAVRAELADFCLIRPGLSSGWLIDMVSLHAYHLRTRLTEAGVEPLRIRRPETSQEQQ